MSMLSTLALALALTTPVAPALDAPVDDAVENGSRVAPGVIHLGSRKVSLRAEKDTIAVTAAEGRFQALRLRVTGSDLSMYNIRVTFGDGSTWSPTTKLHFDEKSNTRRLDLPGKKRIIRKVEFWYRSTAPKTGRATVSLFGIR